MFAKVKHSSRIELSKSAMSKNLDFVRGIVGSHPEIALVVKANAYGHGVPQVISMAESAGIRLFATATSFEAQSVLEHKSKESRVMIMGILYDSDIPWAIENDIEFFVFDIERLRIVVKVAKEIGKPARVHLEVETGGNRTGLDLHDLPEAMKLLKSEAKHIEFVALCSHLAGAESLATHFRIRRQIDVFNEIRKRLAKSKFIPQKAHLASSAAALAMPETVLDLVRVGTAAYGIWPSMDIYNLHLAKVRKEKDDSLTRVFSWMTDVVHVKHVKRDEFVGYGTSYQASRNMTVAVIPIGYANGYPREMSNRGNVLIKGRSAPVVGVVNMNMFMVDVTNIPNVAVNDEVVLIGKQGRNVISLHSFSEFSSALNNEFVSRLPHVIPRTVVR